MKPNENRLDPSELSDKELDGLQPILDFAEQSKCPALKGPDGNEYPLPQPIFGALVKIVYAMRQGKAIVLFPEDETFTTQAAANFLGMSRQYFVTLLETGRIPFHRVGAHRRVNFNDLREYAMTRDRERRTRLSQLFKKLHEENMYETEPITENAQ